MTLDAGRAARGSPGHLAVTTALCSPAHGHGWLPPTDTRARPLHTPHCRGRGRGARGLPCGRGLPDSQRRPHFACPYLFAITDVVGSTGTGTTYQTDRADRRVPLANPLQFPSAGPGPPPPVFMRSGSSHLVSSLTVCCLPPCIS